MSDDTTSARNPLDVDDVVRLLTQKAEECERALAIHVNNLAVVYSVEQLALVEEKRAECAIWRDLAVRYPALIRDGARASLLEKSAEAWREYASHLEWCRSCAEDSAGSCFEGVRLNATAIEADAALSSQSAPRASEETDG